MYNLPGLVSTLKQYLIEFRWISTVSQYHSSFTYNQFHSWYIILFGMPEIQSPFFIFLCLFNFCSVFFATLFFYHILIFQSEWWKWKTKKKILIILKMKFLMNNLHHRMRMNWGGTRNWNRLIVNKRKESDNWRYHHTLHLISCKSNSTITNVNLSICLSDTRKM